MKTIAVWISKHSKGLLLGLYSLALVASLGLLLNDYLEIRVGVARKEGAEIGVHTPKASYETLMKTPELFKERFPAKNLEDFAAGMHWVNARILMAEKFNNDVGNNIDDPYAAYGYLAGNVQLTKLYLMRDYDLKRDLIPQFEAPIKQRYSAAEIKNALDSYEQKVAAETWHPPIPVSYTVMAEHGLLCYLGLCLFSLPYFLVKAKKAQFALRWELRRLPAVLALHPLMFPAYPWGSPSQQLNKMMQFASAVLSVVITLAMSGLSFGQAKSISGKKGKNTDNYELVCDHNSNQPIGATPPLQLNADGNVVVTTGPNADQSCPAKTTPAKPAVIKPPETTVPEKLPQHTFSFHGYLEVDSRYAGMDGGVFRNYPVLQSQLITTLSRGPLAGTYLSLFNSAALTHRDRPGPNFGNEFGTKFGYTHNFGSSWTLDLGVNHDYVSPLVRIPNGDVIQIYTTISRHFQISDRQSFTPFVSVNHFMPFKGVRPKRGTLTQYGVNYAYQHNRFQLSSMGQLLTDTGAFGFDPALVARAAIDPGFRIRGNLAVHPTALYFSAPLTHVSATDGRKPTVAFGPRITF